MFEKKDPNKTKQTKNKNKENKKQQMSQHQCYQKFPSKPRLQQTNASDSTQFIKLP